MMRLKRLLNLFIYNERGISAIESVVAVGLFGAVAVIGLKQSEFMGKSSNDLKLQREMIDFQSGFERLLNRPEICEANFVGKQVPSSFSTIVDAAGNVLFTTLPSHTSESHPGQYTQSGADSSSVPGGDSNKPSEQSTYLNGKVKINLMKLQLKEENVRLKIDYEKLEGSTSSKFSRTVELMVDLNESNKIESCFNLQTSIDETIQYLVAKALCEKTYGVGTPKFNAHFHTNADQTEASCSFDGFQSGLNTQCPQGQSITSIQYDSISKTFTPVCSSPVNSKLCPVGWARSIGSDGTPQCNDLGNYVNMTSTTINTPTQCRLMSSESSTELQLICSDP